MNVLMNSHIHMGLCWPNWYSGYFSQFDFFSEDQKTRALEMPHKTYQSSDIVSWQLNFHLPSVSLARCFEERTDLPTSANLPELKRKAVLTI